MMNIATLHRVFQTSSGVCTDTRSITSNCLFFALKGDRFDGNAFAKQALKEGACKAIVDDISLETDDRFIFVDNVLETLQHLANFHRKWLDIPILAITGTNGKTTTKELVSVVLSKSYNTFATKGNFNNHIGVPLTILSMDKSTELGIVEMGANHIGEIAELCAIAEPNYGLITNVGKAHIEGFGSFEGVKKTKAELYRFIENTGGVLFINSENTHLQSMLRNGAKLTPYGDKKCDTVASVSISNHPMLTFVAQIGNTKFDVKTQLVGAYNLENVLAAMTIGAYFKVPELDIINAIESYVPSNNRSQLLKTSNNEVLLDAYNANPSSMEVALRNFSQIQHLKKVLVLGEMKELGGTSKEEHSKIINLINELKFEHVLLLGASYKVVLNNSEGSAIFDALEDLQSYIKMHPIKNAFVLVKGSRSNKLETIVDFL